jgi:hypothetical protein
MVKKKFKKPEGMPPIPANIEENEISIVRIPTPNIQENEIIIPTIFTQTALKYFKSTVNMVYFQFENLLSSHKKFIRIESLYDFIIALGVLKTDFFNFLKYVNTLNTITNRNFKSIIQQLNSNLFSGQITLSVDVLIQGLLESEEFNRWEELMQKVNEIYASIINKNGLMDLYGKEINDLHDLLFLNIQKYTNLIMNNERPSKEELENASEIILVHTDFNNKISSLINYSKNVYNNREQSVDLNMMGLQSENYQATIINLSQWYNDAKKSHSEKMNDLIKNEWKDYKNKVVPKINEFHTLYESEPVILETLSKFDPEFQVFLPRLAELLDKDIEFTGRALKFTLHAHPELGIYNDMAQVFKPVDTIGKQIDELLKDFNKMEVDKIGKL